MKVRIEVSCLANKNISGVAKYTEMLTNALDGDPKIETHASYFDFLNRQPKPQLTLKKPLEKNSFVPLRVYAKLQSYNIAPPYDLFLSSVDLTIFPNFACWPAVKTRLKATVIHDLVYLRFPDTVETKNLAHLKRVLSRAIKDADFIITISEAVKSELEKEFGLDSKRCVITGIPPDPKFLRKNTNEIHKKYGIPTKRFIYFVGNLEPRKDLPTLIEAYCKLPVEIKDEYSLIMAGGKGWKTEKSLEAIAKAQEAGDKVVHVGFVDDDDAAAFFQKASLFVMPSIYEGFGMPILEAMASNCPVIASDIPVLHEVAGNAALFAKVGDSNDFAVLIQKLLKNADLQKELTQKGEQRLTNFSWSKNVDKIRKQVNILSDSRASTP